MGSVLNQNTAQAYLAGGYSKSSWNNIHWDEKSARKWACYMSAGQAATMAAAGYGALNSVIYAAGASNTYAGAWMTLNETTVFGPFSGFDILTSHMLLYDIITGDWDSAGKAIAGYTIKAVINKSVPLGLLVEAGKFVGKTCEGDL
ncbi:hypothetical protein JWG45_15910 [Leptospira sp. 201903070]|uniref:Uncharacterized protein n=1 Tax=Leptospira ainlahdjerensis TaxID=2810033 RepID=A0ABS2UE25_9LEPT|nr:hypothetical protein [Leptospira ainlahdjerensis]